MRSLFPILIFGLSLTACGKKGALIYPDMLLPNAPTSLTASQIGSEVKLQFLLPNSDRGGRKLTDLAGVKINKQKGDFKEDKLCSSCVTEYRLFSRIYLDKLPENVQRYGNRIILLDGDVEAGKSYSYNVIPLTRGNLDGSISQQVSILLVQPAKPPVIRAKSFPTEIKISFEPQPTTFGRFIGYNLYRTTQQGEAPGLPINSEPLIDKSYTDTALERNVKYLYMARTLEKLEPGGVVESPVSNVVEGMLKNDE